MERLHIGSASRKTGIRARDDLRRDKYNMEDLDEFFDDENEKSGYVDPTEEDDDEDNGRRRRLVGIDGVARALDFNEADADSFMLSSPIEEPVPSKKRSQSRSRPRPAPPSKEMNAPVLAVAVDGEDDDTEVGAVFTLYKSPASTKKSPLRSPLQDTRTPRTEFNDDNYDPEPEPPYYNNDDDDVEEIEEHTTTVLSPVKVPATLRGSAARYGSSLTKNMALGRPTKRKPVVQEVEEVEEVEEVDNVDGDNDDDVVVEEVEQEASLDDSFNDTLYKDSQPTQVDTQQHSSYPSPPPDYSNGGIRKSSRTRFKPLAFWKGERVIYHQVNESVVDQMTDDPRLLNDLKVIPLQEIDQASTEALKKLEPAPTPAPAKKKRKPSKRKNNTKNNGQNKKVEYDYESDPEIEGSEWYANKKLDLKVYADNKHKKLIDRTVVLGPGQVSETSKFDDEFDNFTLHTLFNDYVDYGVNAILDFSIGGQKAMRTSGGAVTFVYVLKGLIHVTLNNDFFVVTKGCSLLIPAFNMYAFKNVGQTDAKLYISQTKVDYD
ncbi:uncharacterized protein KQ657_001898 [Scheffersomyces spartinae]|uniref:Mif2/CENP-C cupin domain-containing protein n=1 Tax=Scheffersomyces spartinae TaxID=45513 RepID=A0A9P7V6H9_9ASCO|nr:uncharacterized protein KQ657_001898 [Scheffersomyces spartinae]KAG7192184.1 hypothetical protein KQ657_001898 [Scheffersomyces spartinae]